MSPEILLGVKVGQRHEPSALCAVEVDERQAQGPRQVHFLVRHLTRIAAGATYPQVAQRLGEVVISLERRNTYPTLIYVDATGLGQPLLDVLAEHAPRDTFYAVYFTHGDRLTDEGGEICLGKARLVCRLQALLQQHRLHLPPGDESRKLALELLDFQVRVAPDANDRYGAFPVGTRDELVTALGLAVHEDPPSFGID